MKIVSIEKFANIVDWSYRYQLFLKISEKLCRLNFREVVEAD